MPDGAPSEQLRSALARLDRLSRQTRVRQRGNPDAQLSSRLHELLKISVETEIWPSLGLENQCLPDHEPLLVALKPHEVVEPLSVVSTFVAGRAYPKI